MSKIYQKMYPGNKNRSKGVLGGFMNGVILRSFYSESQPCSFISEGLLSPFVISEGCNRQSQPFENIKRPGCRVKTSRHDGVFINEQGYRVNAFRPDGVYTKRLEYRVQASRHDNNINKVILKGSHSGSQPLSFKRAGFTLIELLVVVLIIGILAAVALPQYRLSVEKARAAEALSMVKTLWQAQQVYYWANGSYHDNINELDVSIAGHDAMLDNVPRKETQYFSYGVKKTYDYVAANRLPVDRVYGFAVRAEGLVCVSYSDLGKKICQNFAQQQLSGNIWLISSF